MVTPISALQPTSLLSNVILRGATITADISQACTDASISMDTSQSTELTLTFNDDGFNLLRQGFATKQSTVDYVDMALIVAVIATDAGTSGKGNVTLTCRPAAISKLKLRKGPLVMKSVSASQFIQAECATLKIPCVVQTTAKRTSVSRDVYVVGQTDIDSSSWTTFTRLGTEEGYELFEVAGTIYFGRYDYFMKTATKFPVFWSTNPTDQENGYLATAAPQCRTSIDSDTDDRSVTVTVPIQRAVDVRAGYVLTLSGVPGFDGNFFITNVSYDLLGTSDVSITASIPIDPAPQPPDASTTASTAATAQQFTPDQQLARGEAVLNTPANPNAVGTAVGGGHKL